MLLSSNLERLASDHLCVLWTLISGVCCVARWILVKSHTYFMFLSSNLERLASDHLCVLWTLKCYGIICCVATRDFVELRSKLTGIGVNSNYTKVKICYHLYVLSFFGGVAQLV